MTMTMPEWLVYENVVLWRTRGDHVARARVVTGTSRLVLKMVRNFVKNRAQRPDAFQEGSIGVMRACDLWDPEKSAWASFAWTHIRARIQRYLQKTSVPVHIPSSCYALWSKAGIIHRELLLREIPFSYENALEVARRLIPGTRYELEDIAMIFDHYHLFTNVDQTVPSRTYTKFGDILPSNESPLDLTVAQRYDASVFVREVLRASTTIRDTIVLDKPSGPVEIKTNLTLSDQELDVLRRRFADPPEPLADIGASYGFSRERARQLEERALAKVRKSLIRFFRDVEFTTDA